MKYAGPRDVVPRVLCVADGSAYAAISRAVSTTPAPPLPPAVASSPPAATFAQSRSRGEPLSRILAVGLAMTSRHATLAHAAHAHARSRPVPLSVAQTPVGRCGRHVCAVLLASPSAVVN